MAEVSYKDRCRIIKKKQIFFINYCEYYKFFFEKILKKIEHNLFSAITHTNKSGRKK